MGRIRRKDDGLGWPAQNTKVRPLDASVFIHNNPDEEFAYVAGYPASSGSGIVISNEPDQYHGFFCNEWEELSETDSLTDETKESLARAALAAAKKRGYCDETKTILEDLGFPTDFPTKHKITVEIEYELKDGYAFHPSNLKYIDKNTSPVITITKATTIRNEEL